MNFPSLPEKSGFISGEDTVHGPTVRAV